MKIIELKNTKGFVFVDDIDYVALSKYTWYLNTNKGKTTTNHYAHTWIKKTKKFIRMHRMIMNPKDGLVVDHLNKNGLDNRRVNLRTATRSQNEANSVSKTGGVKGVYFDKKKAITSKRYWAYINKDGRRYGLKYHRTQKEAALAYNAKATELYGDFAQLNEV